MDHIFESRAANAAAFTLLAVCVVLGVPFYIIENYLPPVIDQLRSGVHDSLIPLCLTVIIGAVIFYTMVYSAMGSNNGGSTDS